MAACTSLRQIPRLERQLAETLAMLEDLRCELTGIAGHSGLLGRLAVPPECAQHGRDDVGPRQLVGRVVDGLSLGRPDRFYGFDQGCILPPLEIHRDLSQADTDPPSQLVHRLSILHSPLGQIGP